MSIASPIKNHSKYRIQESLDLLKMSEHLTDSHILQSRKTYGKKKDYRSSSISSESSGVFSAVASEEMNSNSIFSFTDYSKESYSEENCEIVTSNYSQNSTIQTNTIVDSEFSLYTEKDMEYYAEKLMQHDSSPSIPEISNSGSKYQRTRKNQKNRLSNQQCGSEEMSESPLYTDNFNSSTDTNESKSASNFLNPKQTPAMQNSLISTDNQLEPTKVNGIKSSDACVNSLPPKPNLFQAGKIFSKGTVSQNPLNNTKFLPILDLVQRFSASRNQGNPKSKQNNKRKKMKDDCESIPAKKIAKVVKKSGSSKINSVENKIPNSTVSSKKYSKNTVLTSDMITTASDLGTVKEGDVKTPPKVAQKNSRSVNNTEISVDMIGNKNNLSAVRKDNFKTPLKSVQKEKCGSVDIAQRSLDMISNINNLSALMIGDVKTPSKSVQGKKSRSVDNTERNVDVIDSVNNLNTPKKAVKTPSKAVQKKNCRSVNKTEKSRERLKENKAVENYARANIKCPSSSSADFDLVKNDTVEKMQSDLGDKEIGKNPLVQSEDRMLQNQTLNNIPNANVGLNYSLNMPLIIAPMPPTFPEGGAQVTPMGIWRTVTDNLSIQSDNNAVSYENFTDLSIPGPSTLSNNHSNMNSSSVVENLETSESVYWRTDDTTTTTIINEYRECNKQNYIFRPRTLLNDGIEFQRFLTDSLKSIENNCILHCKEQSSNIFVMNPEVLNITVKDFFNNPTVTDALLDYLTGVDMGKSLPVHNTNKGYDFDENFETENLLRLVKDFVHTTVSYLIPENALKLKSLNISYPVIMRRALWKMSNREFVIMSRVFRRDKQLFKLKDFLARLSLVALFVIFDEHRNKKFR